METELDIIDSLTAVRYKGPCLQNDLLTSALEGGIRSPEFREIVTWLTHELHVLRKTDETVGKDVTDPSEFAMELSAMLKELGCPYEKFVAGALSERYETKESCMQLLEYLITELMSIKMCLKLKPAEQTYIIPKFETDTAKALEQLTKELNLGKPPENISSKALFDKVNFKAEELQRKAHKDVICEPLLKTPKPLTDEQWKKLDCIYSDLDEEYNLRRQVLITRLEVTIQSFQWSDKMKSKGDELMRRFQKKLAELEEYKYGGKDTNIVALLAARSDLAIIEKTSSANVRKNTGTKIHKHVIGSVPDRGGRAHEHAPPPPEMPFWQQQRSSGPAGGGRGGGGGGNFRGGRGGGGNFGGGGGGNFGGGGGGRGGSFGGGSNFGGSGSGGGGFGNSGGGSGNGGGTYGSSGGTHRGSRGGSGSGGSWQQYSSQDQQQNQNWISGGGRVQGTGWSNDRDRGSGSGSGDSYQQFSGNRDRGSGGGHGRSNYNRGGSNRR